MESREPIQSSHTPGTDTILSIKDLHTYFFTVV